jgi:hypothetical protein
MNYINNYVPTSFSSLWSSLLTSSYSRHSELLLIFRGWYCAHSLEPISLNPPNNDTRVRVIEMIHRWVYLTLFPAYDKAAAMQTLLFLNSTVLRDFPCHPLVLQILRYFFYFKNSMFLRTLYDKID